MASGCTSTLQYPSLHLYPVSEKFLCSVLPTPPSSLICIASVGWYNIMSVGEGMACLSAPGGLPTHSLKEKAIQSEYHPTLPFPCFLSLYTIAPRLCGTALFVFAHTPTNAQRVMVRTKAGRGACKSVFSHHTVALSDSQGTRTSCISAFSGIAQTFLIASSFRNTFPSKTNMSAPYLPHISMNMIFVDTEATIIDINTEFIVVSSE